MKITFTTVSSPMVVNLIKAYESICEQEDIFELKIYNASRHMSIDKLEEYKLEIKNSDFVFIDLMGSPMDIIKATNEALEEFSGNVVPYGNNCRNYLKLGDFSAKSMSNMGKSNGKMPNQQAMKKMANMSETMGKIMPGKMRDMGNFSQLCKYFYVADFENVLNMLYLILRDYGNIKTLPKPKKAREVAEACFCVPKNMCIYNNIKSYYKDYQFDERKPTVVFLYYGHIYPMDYSNSMQVVFEELSINNNVIPIAVSGCEAITNGYVEKMINSAINKPNIIVNMMSFRLGAGPMGGKFQKAIDLLKRFDVPYLHPSVMSKRTVREWNDSIQGFTPSEVLISVMLPEFDGALEIFPIAAKTKPIRNEKFDVLLDEIEIIPDRLHRFSNKVQNYIKLEEKKNFEKKIAIICYNYPPGEANLFGGAFLDTFQSIENILKNLKKEGYDTSGLSCEDLMSNFTAGKLVNSGKFGDDDAFIKYPKDKYLKYFNNLKEKDVMVEEWGESSGKIMTDENNDFNIPALIDGKVLIGLQPARSNDEDNEKLYHDKTIPPHHQYLAFYKYLNDKFKADIVIHVGTHGTIEFLKGKECGMSGDCYPDMLLGDLPHIYLYYVGNPAEATIAKRRSHAQLISYAPPVFEMSSLYDDYLELETLISDYHHALAVAPTGVDDILKNIFELAEKVNFEKDLEKIEKELYRMNNSLIPKGLHIFGENYSDIEIIIYLKGLLRFSRNGIESLPSLVAKKLGLNLIDLKNNGEFVKLKQIDNECEEIIEQFFKNGKCDKEYLDTFKYAKNIFKYIKNNNEMNGFIRSLSSKFNESKTAGDIYRNPDVLPTGTNLVQFDQRFVPTKTGFERGVKIANATIEQYLNEFGKYPESTGVIAWGLETSRTGGETFSQILGYLGVRLDKKNSIWSPKFEIIPLEELGRPRIDVTVNICGFFRDLFPNLVDNLDDILCDLYDLNEKDCDNYFMAHARKIEKMLIDRGYSIEEAKDLSKKRMFGPKEGEYGTGITKIIEEKAWEKEEDIASQFLTSLRYVYSRHNHGRDVDGLYKENLKAVDIVSQIRDNQEYEITDLDHYYEFFGGLAKSVEMCKGKKATMLITDTTRDEITTESVEKAINRGIRTRVLNPKWINGMLKHKYHGASKIADRFENVMGLAATTNSVDEWVYNDLHSKYVDDDDVRKRMEENNPHAYMKILEQMMEYYNRGYWDASGEQIDEIKKAYLEVEDNIEETL